MTQTSISDTVSSNATSSLTARLFSRAQRLLRRAPASYALPSTEQSIQRMPFDDVVLTSIDMQLYGSTQEALQNMELRSSQYARHVLQFHPAAQADIARIYKPTDELPVEKKLDKHGLLSDDVYFI